MSDNPFSTSTPEHLNIAHRLVVLWANSCGTQPEPAERDLALWIVERLALAWDVEVLIGRADDAVDIACPELQKPREVVK